MVEKKFTGLNADDIAVITDEVREHTKECAYSIHFGLLHTLCRDCKCHHYKKW